MEILPSINEEELAWKFTPEQEQVLMRRTVDMVQAAQGMGTVIFLDKSARPLAQLFQGAYPIIFPGQEIPQSLFVNIGSEKIPLLDRYNQNVLGEQRDVDSQDIPGIVKTPERLSAIFGPANIKALKTVLKSDAPENRLIVDDVSRTGDTLLLARLILTGLDPANSYSTFVFLASEEDKRKFPGKGNRFGTAMPWQGNGSGVEPEGPVDHSFFTKPVSGSIKIAESSKFRRGLEKLVQKMEGVRTK